MTALASVFVEVRPQTDKFEPDLKKKLARVDGSRAGVSIGQSLGGGMRVGVSRSIPGIAKGLIAGFAALKGIQVFSGFIADAQESARVARLTANVIRTTGGAAKITADQVDALATAISNKTGVDDEAVQTGANLLLTFKNIKREGTGLNDVFGRATAAAVDLSAAGFGDINGASKALGKALNDPLKGITALGRAGVTFTEQQKKQIAALVKTGDVLGAQKIILKEVESQVGGAAAAASDPIAKLRTILGNVGEDIGTLLLPLLSRFAGFVARTIVPGLYAMGAAFKEGDVTSNGFVGVMERIGVAGRKVADFITGTIVPGFKALVASFKDPDVTSGGFVGQMEQLGAVARQVFDYIRGTVIPTLIDFGKWVVRNQGWLVPIAAAIGAIIVAVKTWTVVTKAFAVVQGILNVVLAANPVGIVVLALVGLAAALIVAYKRSDTFRAIVQAAWAGIQVAASVAWNSFLKPIIGGLVAAVTGLWAAFQTLQRVVSTVTAAVTTAVAAVFNWIKRNWPLLLAILTGPIGAAVILIVRNWDRIRTTVGSLWTDIKSIFREGVRIVAAVFLGLVGAVLDGAAKAFGWVPGLGGKLQTAAAEFRTFRNQVNTALGGVQDRVITVSAALTTSTSAVERSGKWATGGAVRGPGSGTSDSIPALLSNGEHVWTAREVAAVGGHAAMGRLRKAVAAGQVAGFAKGGPVGFSIDSQLTGLTKFEAALAAFNTRVDAMARKLAIAAGGGRVVSFARSQAGKPYVWGAAGPGGYDCSGFVSALVNVAQGRRPYSRLFSTDTLPAGLFAPGHGRFDIGWFRGNPGHVAATVNGVPMESRGGDGVVVGARSRGAGYGYFTHHGHLKGFAAGGAALPGDPPFDLLDRRGRYYRPGLLDALKDAQRFGVRSYDRGGTWPSGTLGVNTSGHDETVSTRAQQDALLDQVAALGEELRALRREVSGIGREVGITVAKFIPGGGRR